MVPRLEGLGIFGIARFKNRIHLNIQGSFFDWSALKMTKCQLLKEFSELVLPKKRLRMRKVKVPELVLLYSKSS